MTLAIIILISAMALIGLTFLRTSITSQGNIRLSQARSLLRANALKQKLNSSIEKSVSRKLSYKKKDKWVNIIKQSGVNVTLEELLTYSIVAGVLACAVSGFVLRSILFALIIGFVFLIGPFLYINTRRNRRLNRVNEEVGMFLNLVTKRYESSQNMVSALVYTRDEMSGMILAGELDKALVDINLGVPISDVLIDMGKRMENKYLQRFADYYEVLSEMGSSEITEKLFNTLLNQYQSDLQLKRSLKQALRSPARDCYALIAMAPIFFIYQATMNEEYLPFMLNTTLGKIGIGIVIIVIILSVVVIEKKLSAPIDTGEE